MKEVRIAELRSRLSEFLRAVVPVRERVALRVRKPASGTPLPSRVKLPKSLKLDIDIVDLLLEERQGHR